MSLIKALRIKDSTFFGEDVRIDFSPKMNCIMGGRGTGKTTLLSILYWVINQDDTLSKEILTLVKSNLGSGIAEVIFTDELGNQFTVFKTLGDNPTVKNSEGTYIPFEDFAKGFGIDYFAAGTIEKIGLDARHRLHLFDGYIGNDISVVNGKIGMIVSQLKQSEIQIKTCRRELSQIREGLQIFGNIDDETQKAKADLAAVETDAGLKAQFELEDEKQTKRTLEQNFLTKVQDVTLILAQHVERLQPPIVSGLTLLSSENNLENDSIKKFRETALLKFKSAEQLVGELQKLVSQLNSDLLSTSKISKDENEKADSAFSNLKQTMAKHRELFQRLSTLSQKATNKKIATEKVQSLDNQLKVLADSRNALLAELNSLILSRIELRRKYAAMVNEILGQKVKIFIKENAINESFEEILRLHLSKLQNPMRMSGSERQILALSNPQELASSIEKGDAEGYAKRCGILDVGRIEDLFKKFKDGDIVFELEACVCEDAPNFLLGVEDGNKVESFKPTDELSTGQRCTAVLPIIFAMTTRPLLVDQPEDNLDNKYIAQSIHQIIRNIKEKRQLIFVTHNPNIPVISDSESNTFLTYFDKQSHLLATGDIKQVKTQIVDLLEGGKDAFVIRKDIYGY